MNETLNAAQLKASREAMTNAMGDVIQQMQLRKWAMEQAITISCSTRMISEKFDVTDAANKIYAFVAKPALELVAKADK